MKNDNIKIIPSKAYHSETLAEVHVRSFRKAYKNIVSKEAMDSFTVEAKNKDFIERIANKSEDIYCVQKDDIIIGFIILTKCPDTDVDDAGEIYETYLDPDFQGKGIGRKLFEWSMETLANSGYKKIVLWVFKDNFPARKLYESMGFTLDGKEMLVETYNATGVRYIKNIS